MRVATLLVTLLSALVTTTLVAQNMNTSNLTTSPYTRYGYGRLSGLGNSVTRSMGDVGIALRSNQYTVLANPASLTAIDTLTCIFTVGLDAQFGTYTEGSTSNRKWNAGFSGMSFQVPLMRNFAMSLSFTPYSSIGYYYGTLDSIAVQSPTVKHDTLAYSSTHDGEGGINNFMIGIGWRALHSKRQELNLGVNAGWLFGSIDHGVDLVTSTQATGTYVDYYADIRGLFLQFGAQYTYRWGKGYDQSLTLGATFSPKLNLSADTEMLKYSGDSITITDEFRNDTKLPMSYGVGLTYSIARKLTLSAEYECARWSQVMGLNSQLEEQAGLYNDTHRFSVGAEYQPRTFTNNYFKLCRYRAGFSYRTNYVKAGASDLHELGATLGMSLPIRRTSLDLGFGYNSLRPSQGSMVKEDYFSITLGLTFNESMFFRARLH